MRRGAVLLAAALFASVPAGRAAEDAPPAAPIIEGVKTTAAPGVPGPLVVLGDEAFPVVTGGPNGEPVVAAADDGRGRIVVFGHGGFLSKGAMEVGETGRLVTQAVRWASGRPEGRVSVTTVGNDDLAVRLGRTEGFRVARHAGKGLPERLPAGSVLVVDSHRLRPVDVDVARAHVKRGGGLVTAGLGWGWKQLNPGRDLATEHPGNRLLAGTGITFADGTLKRTAHAGYKVDAAALPLAHGGRALALLEALAKGEAKPAATARDQAVAVATRAARYHPAAAVAFRDRLRALAGRTGRKYPTPAAPLALADALDRVLAAWDLVDLANRDPGDRGAHPAAAAFPGVLAPGFKRVDRTVTVDAARPRWQGTGLWAEAGRPFRVRVPDGLRGKGWAVRVGCHTDGLWDKDRWRRMPAITDRVPVDQSSIRITSAFGGLVYIEVPKDAGTGKVKVKLEGLVPAARFVRGATDPEEWRAAVDASPVPWAEFESSKIVLTVPLEEARKVEDPVALMERWDAALDACADLAARPRERSTAERIVADVQISVGALHAGYPIMGHLDAPAAMLDLAAFETGKGLWGPFHELGHNHQAPEWTFAGTTEVTCNLFTLYILEQVCGAEPGAGHGAFPPKAEVLRKHFAAGAPFDTWKRKPFLALTMYHQLRMEFGWEAFIATFRRYHDIPAAERPKTDADERDRWLVEFSRTVKRDLGPFFEAWNIPVRPAARAAVADYEPWMPPDFPPK